MAVAHRVVRGGASCRPGRGVGGQPSAIRGWRSFDTRSGRGPAPPSGTAHGGPSRGLLGGGRLGSGCDRPPGGPVPGPVLGRRIGHVIGFRHTDPRFPFLWEDDSQPPGRWHGEGEGPVHYFADTPDGAWAEFLRHEDITDPADVAEVRRAVWAVELGRPPREEPELGGRTLTGGLR